MKKTILLFVTLAASVGSAAMVGNASEVSTPAAVPESQNPMAADELAEKAKDAAIAVVVAESDLSNAKEAEEKASEVSHMANMTLESAVQDKENKPADEQVRQKTETEEKLAAEKDKADEAAAVSTLAQTSAEQDVVAKTALEHATEESVR